MVLQLAVLAILYRYQGTARRDGRVDLVNSTLVGVELVESYGGIQTHAA